ncbi:MAG: ATP-grasp domain-containing protein [Candidatus Rokubacteria bacterium]|nr:ATP-grasp domain-containing protein [Candidatus Rokubacteria bacterium]
MAVRRVLLLIPTSSYRTEDFVEAALRLGVDLVVASERPSTFEAEFPDNLLTLDFADPDKAAQTVAELARRQPIDAVVPVDDLTTVVGAAVAEKLGLPANSVAAVATARNKHRMREALARAGIPTPAFTLLTLADDPAVAARRVPYPCVLKPTILAASRGVIRADDEAAFVAAFRRIEAILRSPEVAALGDGASEILVEGFVPGAEVALEGLLVDGRLHVLALFDKPDPLDGPFFEETIYVTPSRLSGATRAAIAACTARVARALGLRDGPIHAELRVNDGGPWLIELAARSIGGLCSRTLRFGTGMTLEELILRHALRLDIASLERERQPAGVMMIPIPRRGVLEAVRGEDEARAVAGVEEVTITAHVGQELVPLPEGSRYLGFIFARAETPEAVEAALREAHRRLAFEIAPPR